MSQRTSAAQRTGATGTTSVVVNGDGCRTTAATLDRLLAELGYAGRKVATARNGEFVAEAARATTFLMAGDRIEIVAPRQGG